MTGTPASSYRSASDLGKRLLLKSRKRYHAVPTPSFPVAVAFFLLTNAVFYFMAHGWYSQRQLAEHGERLTALITHKWKAARWGDDYYIGYAFTDDSGEQHSNSARIKGDSQSFYTLGEQVEVLVDPQRPSRSALVEKSHLSVMERMSTAPSTAGLTGILALMSWWVFIARLRRSWRKLHRTNERR